jgi:hypothetical protein
MCGTASIHLQRWIARRHHPLWLIHVDHRANLLQDFQDFDKE